MSAKKQAEWGEAEWLAACEEDGWTLEDVPRALVTEEMCRAACEDNGLALEYVPRVFKTPELCRLACEDDGFALAYVPRELRTFPVCLAACKEDAQALDWTPRALKMEVRAALWGVKAKTEEEYVAEALRKAREMTGKTH
jgi:hypothetical protein